MNQSLLVPLAIIIGGALIGGVLLFGVGGGSNDISPELNTASANLRKVDLEIGNMFCIGCRSSVVNSALSLPGVTQADADPRTNTGWIIYDADITSKEQIVAASVFQAYPARILDDQAFGGTVGQEQVTQLPSEVEQKLNELAQILQERGVELDSFFQNELDDAINQGHWEKANNLLDNYLDAFVL